MTAHLHLHAAPAHAGDVRVFEGHAFVVEAAVSIGGRDVKHGINVHRFANRIPLLFEVSWGRGPSRGWSWSWGGNACQL